MASTDGRALVVGASAGIGRAVALRLADLGYAVAAVGRRKERLDEVTQVTKGPSIAVDVCEDGACERLVTETVEALGGIDLIVHAASASQLALLADTDAARWLRVLQNNLVAPSLVIRAALPHLSPQAVSAVISSEVVGNPYAGLTPYAVSKAALEEAVRGWRQEHPELRFACIRVGATSGTEFGRDFAPELAESLLPQWIEQGRIPSQFMDVNELGRAIADTMDVAVRSPGLDIQDVVIRAAGAMRGGGTEDLLAELETHATPL
jgi:NAD(P)-dependent dehydrogenase (short-subunit alcohol dehydrogenase family)